MISTPPFSPLAQVSIAFVACALARGASSAQLAVFDPAVDPVLGFDLVSFTNFGGSAVSRWEAAVEDLHDAGFRSVTLCPIRFVNLTSGSIATSSPGAPDLEEIEAAAARAKTLGMDVAITPFVIPENYSQWRGTMAFTGSARTDFFADYQSYIVECAALAQRAGADRLAIGTELRLLVRDSANNALWAALITAADAAFNGELGYAANWDNCKNANLTSAIWDHPAIDFIGIDAYFPLATNAEADASGVFPDEAFIALLEAEWNALLDDPAAGPLYGILPFAAARKGGVGMPVIFTETGAIPFNRTATAPFSQDPGTSGQPIDADEQLAVYEALLRATAGRAGVLPELTFWHWGMDGAQESFWYTDTDAPVSGNSFDESLNNRAGQLLSDYVSNPVPSCELTQQQVIDFLADLAQGCDGQSTDDIATFSQQELLGLSTVFNGVVDSTTAQNAGVLIDGRVGSGGTLALGSVLSRDLSVFASVDLDVQVVQGGFESTKMYVKAGSDFSFVESPLTALPNGETTRVSIPTSSMPAPADIREFGFQFFGGGGFNSNAAIFIAPVEPAGTCAVAELAEPVDEADAFDSAAWLADRACVTSERP